MRDWVRRRAAAEFLGVSVTTLRRYVDEGRIQAHQDDKGDYWFEPQEVIRLKPTLALDRNQRRRRPKERSATSGPSDQPSTRSPKRGGTTEKRSDPAMPRTIFQAWQQEIKLRAERGGAYPHVHPSPEEG